MFRKIKTFKPSWIIVDSLISSLAKKCRKTKEMEEYNCISEAIGRKPLTHRCDNVREQIGKGNEQIFHCANQCVEKDLNKVLHLATIRQRPTTITIEDKAKEDSSPSLILQKHTFGKFYCTY